MSKARALAKLARFYDKDSGDFTLSDKVIHSDDINTAIRFPAADTVTVETNGTERLRVDSSGNVGIGTTSPSKPLHLSASAANTAVGLSSVGGSGRDFDITSATSGALAISSDLQANLAIFDGINGNVGIGVSPTVRLHVGDSTSASSTESVGLLLGRAGANTGDKSSAIMFDVGGGGGQARIYTERLGGPGGNLLFATADTSGAFSERARITSSGAFQVGSSSADTNKLWAYDSSANAVLKLRQDGAGPIQTWHGNGGGELVRIDASGNLGIGVTPVTDQLSASFQQGRARFAGGASDRADVSYNYYRTGGVNTYIGTDFATVYRQISGQHQWLTAPSGTAGSAISFTQAMTLDASGNLEVRSVSGNGTLTLTSNAATYSSVLNLNSSSGGVSLINASQVLRFDTNGNERARIDASGNVGIGGTSPSQKLYVNGAIYATGDGSDVALYMDGSDAIRNTSTGGVTYHDVATGSAAHGQFVFRSSNALTERLRIDASGNVGIGTTSPNSALDVASATSNAVLSLTATGVQRWQLRTERSTGNFQFYDQTAGATDLTLTTSGNLGLGVTPSSGSLRHFEVGAVGNAVIGYPADAAIYVTSNAIFASGWKYTQTGKLATRYAGEAGRHQWFTAPSGTAGNPITFTQAMTLDASGNLGIGTTTPSTRLEVVGNIKDTLGPVRAAPIQTKSGAYVVVASDAGQTIYISTGGVTINASILSAGDMITIVNNSASSQTITAGASVTFRLAGSATTGNRTLAQYGMATFLCVVGGATPTFYCSGAGLT